MTGRAIGIQLLLGVATVLLILFGASWALSEAPRAREQRKSEMLSVLAGEAAGARKKLAEVVARTRDSRFGAPPFAVQRSIVPYKPQPRAAGLGQVFFSAERIEFVEQDRSAALDKYESLLKGTLDPTQEVIARRNVARLSFAAGNSPNGIRSLRKAVLVRDAADEERLLASYELAEHDGAEGQRLLKAIEEGDFVGVRPGRRAHIHEKLGGDRDRIGAFHAAEAILGADEPDHLVALPDSEVAWRLGSTADGVELIVVPLEELLRFLLPDWQEAQWALGDEAGVRLGTPFPPIDLGLGEKSLSELDAHERAAFWRRFSFAVVPALFLVAAAIFLLLSDLRNARLEKRKRDFLWSITHEFKTPIANILLYAETIHGHGEKDPEKVGGFAQTIGAEAQRLLGMVQQALGVAAGKESAFARKERFDLLAVVESVAAEFRPTAVRRSIDLSVTRPDAPLHLVGMKDFAAKAVGGILDNALKFAARTVQVAVNLSEQTVTIEIDDDGPGFESSEKERIFEPFVQLGDSATRTATGTGLGLTLVRQCVENGGGRVSAGRSALGGASFRIEYPRS